VKKAAAKKAVPAKAVPAKAVPAKAVPKKPAAKKPAPGRKAAPGGSGKAGPVTAHQAHLAHVAHLVHLGLRPKPAAKHQRRMLALGDGVACCAAEALAASLRLTGRPVSDADVLALYRHTADGPDAGATILATLEAAAEFGLSGHRLAAARHLACTEFQADGLTALCRELPLQGSALILGVDLPGPHTVLAAPDGWWSWGEPYDPACWPDAVIEEAWALTWG
jgi:hypothetical protein